MDMEMMNECNMCRSADKSAHIYISTAKRYEELPKQDAWSGRSAPCELVWSNQERHIHLFFSPNRPYLPFLRRAGKQRFTLDVWDKCIKLACPTCCSPRGWLFHKINDTMTQKMNFCPLKGHWTLLNKDTEYEECIQKLFKVPLNWVRFVFLCLLWTLGQTLGHTHRLTVLAAATRSPGFG